MTFKIQIDSVPYNQKPTVDDARRIKTTLGLSAPVSMSPADFTAEILQGKSFSPAVLHGAKAEDWREQQLFCVDIDNEDKTAVLDAAWIVRQGNRTNAPPRSCTMYSGHGAGTTAAEDIAVHRRSSEKSWRAIWELQKKS